MILSEQLKEIKRLDQIRIKNEQNVSKELLRTKYRKSYEKLLNDLSNEHKTAMDYCQRVFERAQEYLSRVAGIYDYEEMMKILQEYYQDEDPFVKKILMAVQEAVEERDKEE